MNTTPTIDQVAVAAATYATGQFPAFESWFSYEKEFAGELLKNTDFVCAAQYATKRVMDLIRYNAQMQGMAAQRGGGAKGVAYVIGHVVGEWLGGHTTIDAELASW